MRVALAATVVVLLGLVGAVVFHEVLGGLSPKPSASEQVQYVTCPYADSPRVTRAEHRVAR